MDRKYILPCGCGKEILVSATQAGQMVRCACGIETAVPALRDLKKLQRLATSRAKTREGVSSWGQREAFLVIGGLITLSGLVMTAWLWLTRPRYPRVEMMAPVETWGLWQELRLGVLREPTPGGKAFAEATRFHRIWTWISLGWTAVGVMILIYAYAVVTPTIMKRSVPP